MSFRIIALGAAALAFCVPTAAFADPGRPAHSQYDGKGKAGHSKGGKIKRSGKRYAGQACPPGLAKKYPGCIPPGQWKKGYRIPSAWSGYYVSYDRLPGFYRDRYELNPDYRYMYRDDRVFVIDALTRAIVDVLVR